MITYGKGCHFDNKNAITRVPRRAWPVIIGNEIHFVRWDQPENQFTSKCYRITSISSTRLVSKFYTRRREMAGLRPMSYINVTTLEQYWVFPDNTRTIHMFRVTVSFFNFPMARHELASFTIGL